MCHQRKLWAAAHSLNQVIDRALRLVQHQLDLGAIQVQLDLNAELPLVLCDGAPIEQVLLALMMNALDAMPQGGNLWVTTMLTREDNAVRIVVRDDGCGIPPEILPRLFEPFLTTKETGRGVGLGLAISRSILERHNGDIEVQSEIGRGTTFTVTLPWDGDVELSPAKRSYRCTQREVRFVESQGKLLIVDDELSVRDSLGKWFREEGYEIGTAESASDALTRMAENKWDLALLDIKMRGTDGIELQRRLHEMNRDLIVIMMTGYAWVETAVTALKNGAYDYVSKPLDPDEIAHLVKKALAHKRAEKENIRLRETLAEATRPGDLVGQSPTIRKVYEAIETVGPTEANVLITGESGTGKELVVRAIHAASMRRFHPLVAIHCGALTETLLESELFGHEKGAFTGAQYRKKGKVEIAEGGTVFLDEIGDISLKTQTDLLRVLQEREITRVGGNQVIKVDFGCVAATNKNLEAMIEEGTFRPDLYYRLNVFHIELPPLRERREDIPLLVEHFVRKFALAMNKHITRVAAAAMNQLQQQPWMGNVRELENAVERAMVVAQEPELREQDFIFKQQSITTPGTTGKSLDEIERLHILRVLEECGFNQSRAAEVLDIDRVTLHHKLKRNGWTRATAESRNQDRRELASMNLVHLLPVGKIAASLLDDLQDAIPRRLPVRCEILPLTQDPTPSYHPERQQFHSSEILQRMQSLVRPRDWRFLAVAEVDLYIPILKYVFGEAQMGGPCAVGLDLPTASRVLRFGTG